MSMNKLLQTGKRMKGGLTMENPGSRVVGDETEGDTLTAGNLDGVTTHGVHPGLVNRRVELGIVGRVIRRTLNKLELMSVKMANHTCILVRRKYRQ